jgi:uncharacterized protein (DUF58 family)
LPRPSARAAGLVAGAALLFVVGTNVQAGWLYVIASFLIGAVLAGALLPRKMLRGIVVERLSPPRIHQGDQAPIDLVLTNPSGRGRIGLLVEDAFLTPVRMFLEHLPAAGSTELTTDRIAARRGPAGSTVMLSTSAPFGVARRRREVLVETDTLVLPKVQPLHDIAFLAPTRTSERAIHSYPRRGVGPEFMGVRQYRPGDDVRHVHWPSTARHGEVIVREMEEETTRRLAILIDASRDHGDAWTTLDACCSAAASLAMAAESHGFGARLIWGEDHALRVHGRTRDEAELLDALAMITADPSVRFPDLVDLAAEELRGVQTAVLVFAPWRDNELRNLAPAVERLSERLQDVIALIVDPGWPDPVPGALPPQAIDELSTWLPAAGAQVFRWQIDRPLGEVLEA